ARPGGGVLVSRALRCECGAARRSLFSRESRRGTVESARRALCQMAGRRTRRCDSAIHIGGAARRRRAHAQFLARGHSVPAAHAGELAVGAHPPVLSHGRGGRSRPQHRGRAVESAAAGAFECRSDHRGPAHADGVARAAAHARRGAAGGECRAVLSVLPQREAAGGGIRGSPWGSPMGCPLSLLRLSFHNHHDNVTLSLHGRRRRRAGHLSPCCRRTKVAGALAGPALRVARSRPRPASILPTHDVPLSLRRGTARGERVRLHGNDIHGRLQRMQGNTVFEPIGFDAFGIHSENYALKVGLNPKELIPRNIENFRRQLRAMGHMVDWSHELSTTDPAYYKWTQWIFLQLMNRGLAYKKKAAVNWCPFDKTVLANEQVINGACERCGTPVEQRSLEQWFFRITDYAPRLLANLDTMDWSESTKTAQRNWLGK